MLSITQEIGGMIISTLGIIVAIFALMFFLIWGIREIVVKKPTILKWIMIILFVCMVVTFMPRFS
jgi:amino acid permease